jgi:hypothetical protein
MKETDDIAHKSIGERFGGRRCPVLCHDSMTPSTELCRYVMNLTKHLSVLRSRPVHPKHLLSPSSGLRIMANVDPIDTDLSHLDSAYIAYTNAPTLLTQTGTLFGATTLVIVLRCYVRIVMLRSFGKDDWTILLAFAFATALFIIYTIQFKYGLGKHIAVMKSNEEGYRQFVRLHQVQSILGGIWVGLVKTSIAFFLLRLVTKKAYRWFLHGFIIFMALFTTACIGTLGKWREYKDRRVRC